jgi:hypothetical protein
MLTRYRRGYPFDHQGGRWKCSGGYGTRAVWLPPKRQMLLPGQTQGLLLRVIYHIYTTH